MLVDSNGIVKATPKSTKSAGAPAAAVPFTNVAKRMLGPAAEELAEMWRDQVRLYRYGRQVKCVEKAERMVQEAGFTPQAVPPKILFPLLEGASFEEDEDLHTMWAALLANASSEMTKSVRLGFISLLRAMSPDEAELLNSICEQVTHPKLEARKLSKKQELRAKFGRIVGEDDGRMDARFLACAQALQSAGLIVIWHSRFTLTGYGTTFLHACRPPEPNE
jgi:hypothetical protein